eukprot:449515_1
MSKQKKQTELSVFGYIKQQSSISKSIPIVIIKLIIKFYDIFFYWNIKGKEIEAFINAKEGKDFFCKKIINIKDIEFGFKVYPNGRSWKDKGMLAPYLRLKYLPSNIEHVGVYYSFKCEETQCIHNRFKIFSKKMSSGIYMTNISKCKNLKQINFICYVDIKYIKYKSNTNKFNYIKPLKMNKNVNYLWNINNKLMNKCKLLTKTEYIVTDNFDGNNWNVRFYHFMVDKKQKIALDLNCLWMPYGIKGLEIKLNMEINGDIKYEMEEICKFEEPHFNTSCDDLPFDEPQNVKQISVKINMIILKLWDFNDKIVDASDWKKYGVINN